MASSQAPFARLAFEPRRAEDRTVWFELTLTVWPGCGEPELLARAPGHGVPVRWQQDTAGGQPIG
jgi:hypothetical protein